jgi:hypothetical protein
MTSSLMHADINWKAPSRGSPNRLSNREYGGANRECDNLASLVDAFRAGFENVFAIDDFQD